MKMFKLDFILLFLKSMLRYQFDFLLLNISHGYASDFNKEELKNKKLPLFNQYLKYLETDKYKKAKEVMFFKETFEKDYFEVVL